jgi:hypothetical protein
MSSTYAFFFSFFLPLRVFSKRSLVQVGFPLTVFGMDHSMVMCWAHMRERVEKKLCLIEDKSLHIDIMDDVDTLQLSKNRKTFDIATKLFLKK